MKLNTFYNAQKIVKELEDVKRIREKLESGQRTVTINMANLNPNLKKELTTMFKSLEEKLETELEKLK